MFHSLPKSQTAIAKAAKLSSVELEVFNMHVTAALLRPDCHLNPVDYFHAVVDGIVFELMTAEIDVAIMTLAFHPNGSMGILDFVITAPLIIPINERGLPM